MDIFKKNILFFLYFFLLSVMVYYKISIDYYTPDEKFYLFSESMLYDNTVAMRYKFVALLFRFINDNGGFIALMLINSLIVWLVNKKIYRFASSDNLLNHVAFGFLFPSVIFYSSSFLRDFYIYLLALQFLIIRYSLKKRKLSYLIVLCIGFLKVELALIILSALGISKFKINPLIFILLIPAAVILWYFLLLEPVVMDIYIKTLLHFEPTVFENHSNVFFGLQELEPTPLNGTLNLLLSYANLFFPFLISWPTNTGNGFNFLMGIDSFIFFICLVFGIIGFNRKSYFLNEIYRVSVIVLLLSIIYGYFMVTPMTSLRMHIHFIPFLIVFITGSRFRLWKLKY